MPGDYHQNAIDPFPTIPELGHIGRADIHEAIRLGEHRHPDGMEICYIERGVVSWWAGEIGEAGEVVDVPGGHAYVTWPDEPHGGIDDAIQPSKFYWLEIKLTDDGDGGFLGLPGEEGSAIREALRKIERRTFPAPQTIGRHVDRIYEVIASERTDDPAGVVRVRVELIGLLLDLIAAESKAVASPGRSAPVTDAIRLMDQHLCPPLTVPDLAERVDLSPTHFHRVFREQTGLSPADFYLRRRITAARRLLQTTDQSILDIALRCGFSSSQYMATAFRRVTGKAPSDYRG